MDTPLRCPHCGGRMEPADRRCPFCGSRRSVAITAGLPPIVADASNPALAAELQETMAPDIVVLRELGRGGMGLVFLAREIALRRLVVIKVLAPELASDATARARFRREAEAAAAVAHPNVVAVYQAGELPRSKTAYLVMQFIDGPTLAEEFPAGTVAPEARAKRVMAEVAAALAAAHARNLIHRDIKPANIMLERETGRAIVLDFGVSAARHSAEHRPGPRITQEGVTLGTPVYMSPEQAAAEPVTDRSDVYSLGVVMFELVTGHAPFDERTPVALAAAHLHKVPPTVESMRPDLAPEFAGLIDRCLAKGADARPDAAAVARALGPSMSHTIEWPPPGLDRLHGTGRQALARHRLAAGAAFAYLFVLAWLGASVAGPGWLLLSAGLIAFVIGIGFGAERSSHRALRWARAGRQAGYPLRILSDVALDPPRDRGALVVGSGSFALVPVATRTRWLRHRRWAAAAEAGGLVLSALALLLWIAGAFGDAGGGAFGVVGIGVVFGLIAPGFVGQGVSLALRWGELRIRLAAGRRPERWLLRLRTPVIRRDLAEGWLAGAGETPLPREPRWRAAWLRLASEIGSLPSAVAALILISAMWASAFNRDPVHPDDTRAWSRWWTESGPGHDGRSPWLTLSHELDATLAGWVTPAAPDSVAARALLMDAYGPPPAGRAPWANLRTRADTAATEAAWSALPHRLAPGQVARLAADTTGVTAGLTAFRAAAAAPPSGGWYARPGLPVIFASARTFRLAIDLAFRDAAAGALALDRGQSAIANERAHEVLSISRMMLTAPSADVEGAGMGLAALGGRMLSATGLKDGDTTLARRGAAIESAATDALRPEHTFPIAAASLAAAQPDSRVWLTTAGDSSLPPSARWLALQAVVDGSCWNQREILVGPSSSRVALLREMARQVDDQPDSGIVARPLFDRMRLFSDPWRITSTLPGSRAPTPPVLLRPVIALALRPILCDDARWRPARRQPD